jgi:cbb3-type cytochrome oxidase subunit 3
MMDWVAWYKFGRLALLALLLIGISIWLFGRRRRDRLEAPARRMLLDDDLEGGDPQ